MDNKTNSRIIPRNLFTYWEGGRPFYIQECLKTFKSVCKGSFNVQILTPDNIKEYVLDLHPNYQRLQMIAHKADCIRVAVMRDNGGIWVDADTIFMNNPIKLLEQLDKIVNEQNKEFFYMKWDDGRILNGYFVSTPENVILKKWLDRINSILINLESKKRLNWTEFGEQILTPLVEFHHRNIAYEIDRRHFIPINIDRLPFIFFEEITFGSFLSIPVEKNIDVFSIGLNHSFFMDNFPNFVEHINKYNDLIKGSKLINNIFKTFTFASSENGD